MCIRDRLWDDKEAIVAEIERLVPALKENGGYIFSSDHSIPNTDVYKRQAYRRRQGRRILARIPTATPIE